MKKISFTLLFICLGAIVSQAQTIFKSHNFYGNGITEYIEYYYRAGGGVGINDQIYYYSSTKPEKIKLNIITATEAVVGMEAVISYQVTFPNQQEVYTLSIVLGGLICKNPDDSEQAYCIDGFNCED